MIPFEFAYYRPDTIEEAVNLWQQLSNAGKQPMYFGGGTELITLGRVNQLTTRAVIDLKGIPECRALGVIHGQLVIGAAISITQVAESGQFPLFTESAARVADHTARCKITVGGNICSNLIYREGVLPFLVTDSRVVVAGPEGQRIVPINDLFRERLRLSQGEFLVQILTEASYLELPHRGVKKTRMSRIDYPLVSAAILKKDDRIRLAITGLCPFPFRSEQLEADLNDPAVQVDERINRVIAHLPAPILEDIQGSAAYREFVFRSTLQDTLTKF